MSKITYQTEKIIDIKDEIDPLIKLHWEEIALNKDKILLDPDWDKYFDLCDSDLLKTFTARLDGELIGYFVVMVYPHLHYKNNLFAVNDVIYLKEEFRNTSTGYKLISFAENSLKNAGVDVLVLNTKVHKPFDNLCEKAGYKLTERIYSKYLGDK